MSKPYPSRLAAAGLLPALNAARISSCISLCSCYQSSASLAGVLPCCSLTLQLLQGLGTAGRCADCCWLLDRLLPTRRVLVMLEDNVATAAARWSWQEHIVPAAGMVGMLSHLEPFWASITGTLGQPIRADRTNLQPVQPSPAQLRLILTGRCHLYKHPQRCPSSAADGFLSPSTTIACDTGPSRPCCDGADDFQRNGVPGPSRAEQLGSAKDSSRCL